MLTPAGGVTIEAASTVDVKAAIVTVDAAMSHFKGVVTCETLIGKGQQQRLPRGDGATFQRQRIAIGQDPLLAFLVEAEGQVPADLGRHFQQDSRCFHLPALPGPGGGVRRRSVTARPRATTSSTA